ncbi:MAG: tol-pal system YbgF family protein [Bacteroidia bacterium]
MSSAWILLSEKQNKAKFKGILFLPICFMKLSNFSTHKNYFNFLLPLLLTIILGGFTACGSEGDSGEQSATAVEELEVRYQALLDQPADGKQMDEVWSTMKELASAYYQRGQNSSSAEGPEDMYRAADLYSASFEYKEAVNIYDQIIDQHADHKRAADALFAKGFIYNDKIGDTAQARSAYEQFLRQYPDHQMVQAAQTEIQLLGVPAEEWLKRIEAADSAAKK